MAMESWRMLATAGGVLLLALAVLAIRYVHSRYPCEQPESSGS
jgi:hypothetical protein